MPSWMEVFGFVTGAACVALLVRQNIENWPVWIVANDISVGLLIAKGLYVSSGRYLVYQVLCAMGLLEWRRALQREATSSAG